MRNAPTDAERRLWLALRDRRMLGVKFTRQFAVGGYIADFACRELKLIIELDGGLHDTPADERRDQDLAALGYHVVRFWNADVFNNLPGVVEVIAAAVTGAGPTPQPPPQGEGEPTP